MTTLKRGQPLFFSKAKLDFHSSPNATFLRDLGMVNNEPVCEIARGDWKEPWIVRYSEIKTEEQFHRELAEEWTAKIKAAKEAIPGEKKTKVAIAAKLGISTTTLRRRMQWLAEQAKSQ